MTKRSSENENDKEELTLSPPQAKKQKGASSSSSVDENPNDGKDTLKSLEAAYRTALKAFKKDKTNKDLRRAKSAAKKEWDAAVLAAAGDRGVAVTCKDCSQMFVFVPSQPFCKEIKADGESGNNFDGEKNDQRPPTRCEACNDAFRNRLKDRTKRDSSGKNMCYDFQRGECTRGNRCRFSHNLEHGGSANKKAPLKPVCFEFRKGKCDRGDKCRFRHENVGNPRKTGLAGAAE